MNNGKQDNEVIHIRCGKLSGKAGGKVGGKGWEKERISFDAIGEMWVKKSYPHHLQVIPKVIHIVFHAIYQMFIPNSTDTTITTNLIYR